MFDLKFRLLRSCLPVISVVMFAGLAGCGGETIVEVTPAQGVVKINGEPAAGIMVQFTPDVSIDVDAVSSFGVTDAEGVFILKTKDGRDGAMIGKSKVILTDTEEERPPQGQPVTTASRIPAKYSKVSAGSLTIDVFPGDEPIVIEVKN